MNIDKTIELALILQKRIAEHMDEARVGDLTDSQNMIEDILSDLRSYGEAEDKYVGSGDFARDAFDNDLINARSM